MRVSFPFQTFLIQASQLGVILPSNRHLVMSEVKFCCHNLETKGGVMVSPKCQLDWVEKHLDYKAPSMCV
jgi:hypothetical protein